MILHSGCSLLAIALGTVLAFPPLTQADVAVGLFQTELPVEIRVQCDAGLLIQHGAERENAGTSEITFSKKGSHVTYRLGWWKRRSLDRITLSPLDGRTPLQTKTPKGVQKEIDGTLELRVAGSELLAVARLTDERYVASVAAAEMPADWPAAALRAQAILARTFLERHRHRHADDGYDLCDLTHCQAYRGRATDPRPTQAAFATRGRVLLFDGQPIDALFHSTCGGRTASNQSVWPRETPAPYLQGVNDAINGALACARSPYLTWTVSVTPQELKDVLASLPDRPALADVEQLAVVTRDPSGRATQLHVVSASHTLDLAADTFYRAWGRARGWHELKSTSFEISREQGVFVFKGRGLGHGVGLCQYGAKARAEQGAGDAAILAAYFPGTILIQRRKENEN